MITKTRSRFGRRGTEDLTDLKSTLYRPTAAARSNQRRTGRNLPIERRPAGSVR